MGQGIDAVSHEISGPNLEGIIAYLGQGMTAKDIKKFFIHLVVVEGGGVTAWLYPYKVQANGFKSHQIAQRPGKADRVGVELMDVFDFDEPGDSAGSEQSRAWIWHSLKPRCVVSVSCVWRGGVYLKERDLT